MLLLFKKKPALLTLVVVLLVLPSIVFAGSIFDSRPGEFDINVMSIIEAIFGIIWPVTVAIVIAMFIWAGISFLTAAGDPGKLKTAKSAALWGVVGVAVILLSVSIIGFVNSFVNPGPIQCGNSFPQCNGECPGGGVCGVDGTGGGCVCS